MEEKAKSPTVISPLKKEFVNGVYENHKLVDDDALDDPLAEIDVSKWLVFKRPEEDGPDIRGGHPDALIVLATKANKNGTCGRCNPMDLDLSCVGNYSLNVTSLPVGGSIATLHSFVSSLKFKRDGIMFLLFAF